MANFKYLSSAVFGIMLGLCAAANAAASRFDIAGGDLKGALDAYARATGIAVLYPAMAVEGVHTKGAKGELSPIDALTHILAGTGFVPRRHPDGTVVVVRDISSANDSGVGASMQIATAAAPTAPGATLETVTVTSSKIGGDVQNIPISITAFSQEQLKESQTVGGPDLVRQVPNFNFSKTNFTGYNIEIRGIGTQAISVTTDPAVAVAFNDIPFIRNHFFEQEFYDVGQVEVLRGPQGTLYGRNATAGVVNLVSAKPSDQFEAMISADVGNYEERRLEGMINLPLSDDRLDLRVAGEWTKRQGYTFDETTNQRIDGRDLWSTRMTLGMKPFEGLQAYLVWEHFNENDDRERSTKQLCNFDPGPNKVGPFNQSFLVHSFSGDPLQQINAGDFVTDLDRSVHGVLSQGCLPASLYSPASYETPNGAALPIVYSAQVGDFSPLITTLDPYASDIQPRSLRVIQSQLQPFYRANNDTIEFNVDYTITPSLTFSSQTGYNHDFLASSEDFNRFNSTPGIFFTSTTEPDPGGAGGNGQIGALYTPNGVLCDPQLGCSTKFIGEDLSQERAWQLSQEFRLASNFSGPLNFSVGANYLHYETLEDYYVFLNLLTLESRLQDKTDTHISQHGLDTYTANGLCQGLPEPHTYPTLHSKSPLGFDCSFTDGTPLTPGFNGQGHNYFRSANPYVLSSYAGFGEVYYQVLDDLKLTGGLRWTDDQKHFVEIPSEVLIAGWGYPISGVVNQQWNEWTGRAVANWTPKLDFTDQTLVYGSYSRGYKAGGANPPPPNFYGGFEGGSAIHPLTFAPEFVNAFEMGTKNTLLDGALTLNGDVFYYDYKGYQISEIVDRTSINLNFDANIRGAEIETSYEPLPGLRFNFAGGWEDTKLANGSQAIDLMDRTAGHPGWLVVKPWIGATSNCILPQYVVADLVEGAIANSGGSLPNNFFAGSFFISSVLNGLACQSAYSLHQDPVNWTEALLTDSFGIPPSGFDGTTAPNNGEGFDKNLTGNRMPNAPPFTVSFGAQYSMPLSADWAGTLRGDYYWQDYSWARVFNDNPYDRLRGYTNVNLTLIFTNQNGWQVMLYDKNVFNTTAITGAFLNSDDTALTTNVFVTDPKLIGIRVTKNW
jgi:outer membrane receptor protein involved in Fe transport